MMNKIVLFTFLVATVVLISSAEPVQYRANQRVRPIQKQQQLQQKPADNPDSENIEVTTVNAKKDPQSANQSEKQQEVEEAEEPKGKAEPTTESNENAPEDAPYVPSGWKPAGNLLVLPAGGGVYYIGPQPRVAPPTTTEAQVTTETPTEGTTEEGTTESATTESATTESATTESATEDSTTEESSSTENVKLGRTKVETTSEPDAESVDVETTEAPAKETPEIPQHEQPPSPTAVNTFFVQLSDGTFQRVVFVNAPAAQSPAVPWTAAPWTAALQAQPVLQTQPFYFNPAYPAAPKVVSFTSQYQAW